MTELSLNRENSENQVITGKDGRVVGKFGSYNSDALAKLAEDFDRYDEEVNNHAIDGENWLS